MKKITPHFIFFFFTSKLFIHLFSHRYYLPLRKMKKGENENNLRYFGHSSMSRRAHELGASLLCMYCNEKTGADGTIEVLLHTTYFYTLSSVDQFFASFCYFALYCFLPSWKENVFAYSSSTSLLSVFGAGAGQPAIGSVFFCVPSKTFPLQLFLQNSAWLSFINGCHTLEDQQYVRLLLFFILLQSKFAK